MLKYFFKKHTTYAQYLQDLFVEIVFFSSTKNGYFIDIGAYDGIKFSNSYLFEKHKLWKGIAVEPNESIFIQLQKNRSCVLVKGVITDVDGELDYLRVDGDGEMLSGVVSNFDEKHKLRIEKNTQVFGGNTILEKVKSYSINSLIHQYKINKIDLLSIDTEGSEFQILKDFPFESISPKIVLVENNYRTNQFNDFLKQKGYNFCFRLGDDIFCKKEISLNLKFRIYIFRIIKKLKWYKIGY